MNFIIRRRGLSSTFVILIVALILAIGSFFLIRSNTAQVIMATQPIEAGTQITQDLFNNGVLTVKNVPKDVVTENTLTFDDIPTDAKLYVVTDLDAGQILTKKCVANNKDGLLTNDELVKNNQVLFTLSNEDNVKGLTNQITRGTKVNLISIQRVKGSQLLYILNQINPQIVSQNKLTQIINPEEDYAFAKTFLQGVKVYGVIRDKENNSVKQILIGVSPSEAELIAKNLEQGIVYVTMNNVNYKFEKISELNNLADLLPQQE